MKRMLIILLLSTTLLHAETWSGRAAIRFDGTSTLHDWGGSVIAQPFKVDVTMNGGMPARIVSTVTVKAAEMDTQEARRDENMRKAMKAAEHPLIIARINAKLDEMPAAGRMAKLPLELDLLGRPQNVIGTISNWSLDGGRASFDLDFPVSMKASGISVPAVLLFIRVGDGVKVRVHVNLTRN